VKVIHDTGWLDSDEGSASRVMVLDIEGEDAWRAVGTYAFPFADSCKAECASGPFGAVLKMTAQVDVGPPAERPAPRPWWKFWGTR